jgi:hypothetical protein
MSETESGGPIQPRVRVHADGGLCHGTPLTDDGWCESCGLYPDMQSIELWSPEAIATGNVERAMRFVDENGYATPEQCELLVGEIRRLRTLTPSKSGA